MLGHFEGKIVDYIKGCKQQMLAIGRAMMSEPQLILWAKLLGHEPQNVSK
ncbi:unnamed protein product, partial [marine sediment metagenome]